MVLDLSREDLTFEPGDIVMVQPKNDQELVEAFIQRLGYWNNQMLKITINPDQLGQVS